MNLSYEQRVLLHDVAKRSFRDIADQDYLTARLCFKNNLTFQFLWMAQQAIEKYIKCILLYNKVPVKSVRHDLNKGLELIRSIPYMELDLCEKSIDFINYINEQGPNRYFQNVMYTRGLELITLDRTVWELRRYCRLVNYEIEPRKGEKINMTDIELRSIKNARIIPAHKHRIIGGYLEKRLKDNKYKQGDLLTWKNFYFGKKVKKKIVIARSMQWSSPTQHLHPESLQFLGKFIQLT